MLGAWVACPPVAGRDDLTDDQWALIEPLMLSSGRGGQWRDHRQVVDGIPWQLRTGAPWRDLPERYRPWKTLRERLRRWTADAPGTASWPMSRTRRPGRSSGSSRSTPVLCALTSMWPGP